MTNDGGYAFSARLDQPYNEVDRQNENDEDRRGRDEAPFDRLFFRTAPCGQGFLDVLGIEVDRGNGRAEEIAQVGRDVGWRRGGGLFLPTGLGVLS